MPPVNPKAKVEEIESLLKPFQFLGIVFSGTSGNQKIGRCPFCERDNKFYVNEDSGKWECKICTETGNLKTFIRRVYEASNKVKCDYSKLSQDRKLLSNKTLEKWGLCKNILSNEWMLPAYTISKDSKTPVLTQLYMWREDKAEKRWRFICKGWTNSDDGKKTAHGLFCGPFDPSRPNVDLLEGLWDAAAYSEVNDRDDTNILASPGANVFYDSWLPAFSGKNVTILYDNDHSKKHPKNDTVVEGSGILGVKRVSKMLATCSEPTTVSYLKWGEDGFDPSLPNRYDVRDCLSQGKTLADRKKLLEDLLTKVSPIDPKWTEGASPHKKGVVLGSLKCHEWNELEEQWKKAMSWNDGLGHALPAMIACAASPNLPDDLIWLKVMSPASTGKTELAEALAVSENDVVMVSTFTGLHSGSRLEDGYDGSLISTLGGRCFIIKEGDTLLKMDNREKVWSELRDAYDKNSRTHYKNGVANQYLDWAFSHVLCGTPSLHEMDDSELGQRYLNIEIMDKIDPKTESTINRRKLGGLFATLQQDPENESDNASTDKIKARRMTAGYLQYLKPKMAELIRKLKIKPSVIDEVDRYAQYVAYFRARPSKTQNEQTCREMSTRLATQIGKLALTLTVALGKTEVDQDVMKRIRKVAIDTGKGKTSEIAKVLYEAGEEGEITDIVAPSVLQGRNETRDMLQFMQKIDICKAYRKEGKIGSGTAIKWRLTPVVRDLYAKVMDPKDASR